MDLNKKSIHTEKEYPVASSQFVLEEDLIIPDSRADVRNILLDRADVIRDEVRVLENHIIVKGKLNYCILYKPDSESQNLCYIKGEIPFEEQLFMDEVKSGDTIRVNILLEDLDTSIINSRKINLRALISLTGKKTELYDEEISTSVTCDEPLEYCTQSAEILSLAVLKKDICRIREEIELPKNYPNILNLLWSHVNPGDIDIRPGDGKLTVKCNLRVFFLYESASEDNPIRYYETTLPVNTQIDCNGSEDSLIPAINYYISHNLTEVRQDFDGEDRVLGADLVLDLDIRLYREEKINMLSDVYGTRQDYIPTEKNAYFKNLRIHNISQHKLDCSVSLPETTPSILSLCYPNCRLKTDTPQITENGLEICGLLQLQILCITENDTDPYHCITESIPFCHTVEVPQMNKNCSYMIDNSIDDISVQLLGNDEIGIKATISFHTFVYESQCHEVIDSIDTSPIAADVLNALPGIIVYFVKEGDTLWKIGKQYYVTVNSIMEQNDLTGSTIHPGDRLIIVR